MAKVTTSGVFTEFSIPTPNSGPSGIAAGRDGNVWFTEFDTNKVGKVTGSGVFTEYAVPTQGSKPQLIAPAPDGNLWFTEFNANKVAKITTSGVITEYTQPMTPSGITAGPDGNIWISDAGRGEVAKISMSGVVTVYAVPTAGRSELKPASQFLSGLGASRIVGICFIGLACDQEQLVGRGGLEPRQLAESSHLGILNQVPHGPGAVRVLIYRLRNCRERVQSTVRGHLRTGSDAEFLENLCPGCAPATADDVQNRRF